MATALSHIFRIDRNLIRSVESSHQRYLQKFAENPKEIARKEREEKAKPIVAEVHSLDRHRILHETTIKDLREESEAEKVSKLESVKLIVTRSNTLKRAANYKQAELDACVERKRLLLEQKNAKDA